LVLSHQCPSTSNHRAPVYYMNPLLVGKFH
jgi:hypothetical protein